VFPKFNASALYSQDDKKASTAFAGRKPGRLQPAVVYCSLVYTSKLKALVDVEFDKIRKQGLHPELDNRALRFKLLTSISRKELEKESPEMKARVAKLVDEQYAEVLSKWEKQSNPISMDLKQR
jgi:hypothetical protein